MPSKNRLKQYETYAFYHVYNRGVNKRIIYKDPEDYAVFLNLLKRYLCLHPTKDKKGREYTHLYGQLELLAYCLMPNHFHLLVYQEELGAISKLLQSVCGTYVTYFNKKYERLGPLFQDVFKASRVTNDSYAQHISRYIHLNPKDYLDWEYSSLPYYMGDMHAEWVRPERILEMFDDVRDYDEFLKDYVGQRDILNELKYELADR